MSLEEESQTSLSSTLFPFSNSLEEMIGLSLCSCGVSSLLGNRRDDATSLVLASTTGENLYSQQDRDGILETLTDLIEQLRVTTFPGSFGEMVADLMEPVGFGGMRVKNSHTCQGGSSHE